jgi:hypothetical protein
MSASLQKLQFPKWRDVPVATSRPLYSITLSARSKKDSGMLRSSAFAVFKLPFEKRVISRQAPRSWKEDAESIDSTRLLRPRGARPSDTETNKDDDVAPSHGLPQRLSTEHFQSITLAHGNRRCPRHLPMLQWVIHVIMPSRPSASPQERTSDKGAVASRRLRVRSRSTRRRAARSICQRPFDTLACVCLKGSVELIRQIDVDRDKPDAQHGRRGLSIAPQGRIRRVFLKPTRARDCLKIAWRWTNFSRPR